MKICPKCLPRMATRGMIFFVMLILLAPLYARGQAVTGTLPVRVVGPNGELVAGATVTVRSLETNFEVTQTTDDEGLVTFVGLPPGRYRVSVSVGVGVGPNGPSVRSPRPTASAIRAFDGIFSK